MGILRRCRKRLLLLLAATTAVMLAGSALGQNQSVAEQFMQRMDAIMSDMDHSMTEAPMNGNIDHDFAAMMIPHHQGAIEMAKAELLYGKDPVMRRLAQEILVDQQSEIDAMNLWLSKQPNPKQEDVAK